MATEESFDGEGTEPKISSTPITTPPPIPTQMTPPELTPEIIAQGKQAEEDWKKENTPPELPTTPPLLTPKDIEWIKDNTPPPIPGITPPPLPQDYKINQVTNRYNQTLSNIEETKPILNAAKEKEDKALERATAAQIEADKGLYSKPENGVENIINNIILYLKRVGWGKAKYNSDKIEKELARPLGGEALVNSSLETTQRATNPVRLETLIEANQQNPIENASPQMTSALEKQDEIAKQLKQGEQI